MRYLRTLATFGPGLVLAAGALGLALLPDHSAQNTWCAGTPVDTSSYPPCPLPADHHPAEILRFAAAAGVFLLIPSWTAWRRHRRVPMRKLTRHLRAGLDRRISVVVWLSGSLAVMTPAIALDRMMSAGMGEVDPGGMYADCGAPDATRGVLDECRQINEDHFFGIIQMVIVTAVLVLVWGCALTQSRRRLEHSEA